MTRRIAGVGVWSGGLRWGDPGEGLEAAAELEELGYSVLWIPDVGGDVFGAVERLMAATTTATVATGVLNLWKHSAQETTAAYARLTSDHGERFLVGIGVSHPSLIQNYAKPLIATTRFLDALDSAPHPLTAANRVLAALGPKMLELARARAAGAHPYNVTADHTVTAREALGPSSLLLPEQAVVLTTDRDHAHTVAREHLAHYFAMPNYVNSFRRMGFTDEDFAAGGSDRLVDAIVAWGDAEGIRSRVREHFDAGADHVCIQVLGEGYFPRQTWKELAGALTR